MTGAKVPDLNHFGELFYTVISWMENGPYNGDVWVLDADHITTKLVLFGDPTTCSEFQAKAAEICFKTPDPSQDWRYY